MKKTLALSAMLAFCSIAAWATNTCVGSDASGGVVSVDGTIGNATPFSPGFSGTDACNIGGITFSNFSILGGSGLGSGTGFDVSISINGTNQLNVITTNLASIGNGAGDFQFYMTVTGGLSAIMLTGSDSYSEQICSSPISVGVGTCSVNGTSLIPGGNPVHYSPGGTGTFTEILTGSAATEYIFKDVSGSSSEFAQGVVPEPSTYSMLGIGLLGLGAFARKRKK